MAKDSSFPKAASTHPRPDNILDATLWQGISGTSSKPSFGAKHHVIFLGGEMFNHQNQQKRAGHTLDLLYPFRPTIPVTPWSGFAWYLHCNLVSASWHRYMQSKCQWNDSNIFLNVWMIVPGAIIPKYIDPDLEVWKLPLRMMHWSHWMVRPLCPAKRAPHGALLSLKKSKRANSPVSYIRLRCQSQAASPKCCARRLPLAAGRRIFADWGFDLAYFPRWIFVLPQGMAWSSTWHVSRHPGGGISQHPGWG